jgi:signal transduction histidine kinase/ActR/RegA family two-component response regulator
LQPEASADPSLDREPDFFDVAPGGLLELEPDNRIRRANAYGLELIGRSAADVARGLHFQDLLSPAGRLFTQTRLWPELTLDRHIEELTLDLVRPDGERTPVLINAVQAKRADGRAGVIRMVLTRASTRRAYEAEMPKARSDAEEAAQIKSDFLANISHEIRTPLNGIIGVTSALERTELAAPQREMVGLIQSSGVMLERILSDVLELSKVQAGGLQLEPRPFDLRLELEGVLQVTRLRCEEKGLAFATEFSADAAGCFEGDAVRVKQVLSNLLSNAVKFTEAGSIQVRIELQDQGDDAPLLTLMVDDTGVGFDESVSDTLFQRFRQADSSITRKYGGTGLGLAICKQLIDLMQGRIEVRSRPGAGSRFKVSLPLSRVRDSQTANAESAHPIDVGPLPRILLVEDHPTNRKVVELILGSVGVDLVCAENGELGVEAWRRGGFDLVLMDMQMPVMDGLSATRAIRAIEAAEPRRCRTPIAMLSANAMDHHRNDARAAGADMHIAKPVTAQTLLGSIESLLSPQSQAA